MIKSLVVILLGLAGVWYAMTLVMPRTPAPKPARIRHPRFERTEAGYDRCADSDFVEGQMNFNESDFRTKSGAVYNGGISEDGRQMYTLHIHSNSVYRLRHTEGK